MPYLVRNPRLACGRFHYPWEDPENGPAEPCLRPMNHSGPCCGAWVPGLLLRCQQQRSPRISQCGAWVYPASSKRGYVTSARPWWLANMRAADRVSMGRE